MIFDSKTVDFIKFFASTRTVNFVSII